MQRHFLSLQWGLVPIALVFLAAAGCSEDADPATSASSSSGAAGSGGGGGEGGSDGGDGGAAPQEDDYQVDVHLGECEVDWQIGGDADNTRYPTSLIAVADVTGDGVRDFMTAVGTAVEGDLELRSGADGSLLETVAIANQLNARSIGADLDGDGALDVAVLAMACGDGTTDDDVPTSGKCTNTLRVVSASDAQTLFELEGPADVTGFAAAAGAVADEDGDAKPDLAVATTSDDPSVPGRIDILSWANASVLRTIQPEGASPSFGVSLLTGADLDGDGEQDFVVGDSTAADSGGRIHAFGTSGVPLWSIEGDASHPHLLGISVAWAGDLDGDGIQDIVAGSTFHYKGAGRVLALSGSTGTILWETVGPFESMGLGHALASAGDLDGDGVPDVLAGAPKPDLPQPLADGHGGSVLALSGLDGKAIIQIEEAIPGTLANVGYKLGSSVGLLAPPIDDGSFALVASAPQAPFQGNVAAGRVLAFRCSP